MKIAIYPGSFNPWHNGHENILDQALKVFDKVIVTRGINTDKEITKEPLFDYHVKDFNRVEFTTFKGLFVDTLKLHMCPGNEYCVIKGLRNGIDFEYEKNMQYNNEDLGVSVPTFYIISDRTLLHVSSSAIRSINKAKGIK